MNQNMQKKKKRNPVLRISASTVEERYCKMRLRVANEIISLASRAQNASGQARGECEMLNAQCVKYKLINHVKSLRQHFNFESSCAACALRFYAILQENG